MPGEETAERSGAGEKQPTLIASRYRLDRSLGAGGSGRVWEGEDTVLQRPVAVKAVELPPHLEERERDTLRTRVLREARAAARIDHPDSVRVFDVVDEADRVYLIMELVQAPTLADVVEQDGFMIPDKAACMGLELLDALQAAHAAGIIHRDVKPRNVMVLPDGHVKLADFGIATVKDDPRITTTGMVMGTPSYMSPEQARGEPADTATDMWGLGALLYYAVEGVSPFDRGEPLPTLNAVLHDEPRPCVRAGALEPVIDALLVKRPDGRPTAEEARSLLAEVADGGRPTMSVPTTADPTLAMVMPATEVVERFEHDAAPPAPAAVSRPPDPPRAAAVGAPPAQPRPDGGRMWLVALGVVAVVAAIAALALANRDDDGGAGDVATTTSAPPPAATEPPGTDTSTDAAPGTTAAPDDTTPTTEAADEGDDEGGDAGADVPANWVEYRGDEGYTVSHPPSWRPARTSGANVDFQDPSTGDYLRIGYTPSPGPDAEAGWEDYAPRFAADHPTYREIRIERVDFPGADDAAIWEYTYEGRRATNLAIVTEGAGFALNFQTSEGSWDERQEIRRAFERSFRLPE